ncbi:MAG: hypothetical protein V3U75_04725 [Methylococcaceae bacterium]
MAIPSTNAFDLTGDDLIDVSTTGFYWQLDQERTIRWALADGFSGENWADSSGMQGTISAIFDTFADYIDVTFEYVGYFNDPTDAYGAGSDITVSIDDVGSFTHRESTLAIGYFPTTSRDESIYVGAAGDIFINSQSEANTYPYTPGSAGWHLLIHEIGHTLGLKHTHDGGGTGRPTISNLEESGRLDITGSTAWPIISNLEELDSLGIDWGSIMSYEDDFRYNTTTWSPVTPMVLDIVGLQYLYGANLNTNTGNSTLMIEDFNDYRTLWDAGGNADYVDASLRGEGVIITLPSPLDSSLASISAGSVTQKNSPEDITNPKALYWSMGEIEHARGSNFVDLIIGNSDGNILEAQGGNDVLFGGDGNDLLIGELGDDFLAGEGGHDRHCLV